MSSIVQIEVQQKRVLSISASGDIYEFPYCVCPVDDDGVDMGIIANFEKHEDAMLFVEANDIAEAKRMEA